MIAVVVLTFDAPAGMLEDCLASLRKADPQHLHPVIVVDNGTRTAELPPELFTGVRLVRNPTNTGYAGGMNTGIREARALGADVVVLLNDDVTVTPGWTEPLSAEMAADERAGAVQPKLLSWPDATVVNSMGVRLGRDGAGVDIGHGQPDVGFDEPATIEAFTGGAVMLRMAMLDDVGIFDERYFLYYEDVDLALRASERGWHHRVAPASVVQHRGSASMGGVGHLAIRLRERNRLWVLFRHRPAGDVARGLWLSTRRLRWAPRTVHASALAAGLAAAPRLLAARFRQG
ncbi:MAG: glycosyltransferase family 2 protein [Ilumatobacteraceae bacterium]